MRRAPGGRERGRRRQGTSRSLALCAALSLPALLAGCYKPPQVPGAFGSPVFLTFEVENRGRLDVEMWIEAEESENGEAEAEHIYLGGIQGGAQGRERLEWPLARSFRVVLTTYDGGRFTLREVRGLPRGLVRIVIRANLYQSRISVVR